MRVDAAVGTKVVLGRESVELTAPSRLQMEQSQRPGFTMPSEMVQFQLH